MVRCVQREEVLAGDRGSRSHQRVRERVRRVRNHDAVAVLVSNLIERLSKVAVNADVLAEKTAAVSASERKTRQEEDHVRILERFSGSSVVENVEKSQRNECTYPTRTQRHSPPAPPSAQ